MTRAHTHARTATGWGLALLCLLGSLAAVPVEAQSDEKAVAILEKGIAALGGPKFTGITSISSSGVFTQFAQGQAGFPVEFTNVFVLPDRERTDFSKKKTRLIQANAGDRGWKFDASRAVLDAQTEDEIQAFKTYARSEIHNVLGSNWKAPDVKVRSLGRKEYAPRQWAEGVAIDYPDGLTVEILFDATTFLPTLSRYHGGSGTVSEARYYFYIDYGGAKVARTIDLYRDGVQTGRIVNDSVVLNAAPPPGHFDQPPGIKAIK